MPPSQSFAYTYDKDDRLLAVVYPDGAQVRYTYDFAGRRQTMTDPDGNVTTYTHHAVSTNKRLANIDHSLLGKTYYSYNAKKMLESEYYQVPAVYNVWQYDSLNRVEASMALDSGFDEILVETNHYNAASIRERVDYTRPPTYGSNYHKLYTYDKALRLKSQSRYDTGDNLLEWWYGYHYDLAGNRIGLEQPDGGYTSYGSTAYNDFNQLSESYDPYEGDTYYYYDANGNLEARQGRDTSSVYYHDRDNRLVGYEEGADLVNYAYDSSGRLLLRTGPDGTKTKYYYNGINLLLVKEKPVGGVWRTKKVNALKEASIGQILAHREYTAWSGSSPTAFNDRWYHYDLLGNVTALTDSNGAVAAQYDMEAFGTVKSGGQNGVHLTTKEWDADSGLYYFYKRWYDKESAQWLQKEPYGWDGPNLYNFVRSNPVHAYDANGLFLDTIWDVGNICYDIYKGNWDDAAFDVVCAAIPGLPAGGSKVAKETVKRAKSGRDGAESCHIIEKMGGETISKAHRVVKDGKVIHQHQDHVGKSGRQRRFPDEWVEYPEIKE